MKYFVMVLAALLSFGCTTTTQTQRITAPALQTIAPPSVPSKMHQPLAREEEIVFSVTETQVTASVINDLGDADEFRTDCLIETQKSSQLLSSDDISSYLKQSLSKKWVKPSNIRRQYQCKVQLQLAPSGCISEINVQGCQENNQLVRSIEVALFRLAPLPEINGLVDGDSLSFEFFAGP